MDPKVLSIGQSILIKRSDGRLASNAPLMLYRVSCVPQAEFIRLPSVVLTQRRAPLLWSGSRTMKPRARK